MIVRLIRAYLAGIVLCALMNGGAQAQQAAVDPQTVVDKLGVAMIDTMKNAKQLAFNGRFQKLAPTIVESYDLARMVSVAVGGAWKQATAQQRQLLVDAFARYTVAVHASRLDGYSGESFKVLGAQELGRGRVVVKSQLVKSNGSTEALDYTLEQNGSRWQIVDVSYRGISDLATRRSEYTSVIKDSGVDRLIAKIDEKTAELGHSKTSTN